jgi:hypothetical protein
MNFRKAGWDLIIPFLLIFLIFLLVSVCDLEHIKDFRILNISESGERVMLLSGERRRVNIMFLQYTGYATTEISIVIDDPHEHRDLYLHALYFKRGDVIKNLFRNKIIKEKELKKGERNFNIDPGGPFPYRFKINKNMRKLFKEMNDGDELEYDLYITYSFDDEEAQTISYPYVVKCWIHAYQIKDTLWP